MPEVELGLLIRADNLKFVQYLVRYSSSAFCVIFGLENNGETGCGGERLI